jgi:hypothetical protein
MSALLIAFMIYHMPAVCLVLSHYSTSSATGCLLLQGTPMINPTRAHFHLSKHIPSLKKSEVKINEQRCMIVADCRTPQEARVVSE